MAIPILNHLDLRSVSELQNAILHTTTHTEATNKAGAFIYDTGSSTLKYCTGTSNSDWISLTGDTNTWRTVTVDTSGNGSADNTLETSETLMLKKGTNITLAEALGVVTISSTDTNTNQLTTFTLRGTTNTAATTVNHGDTITLTAGTGITTTSTSDGVITIASTITDTNTQLSTEEVQDIAGPLVASGGTKTGITITYQDATNDMDFVVDDTTVAGDSGSTGITPGDTLTIAGGTNVTTAMSGDTLTINSTDTNTDTLQTISNDTTDAERFVTFVTSATGAQAGQSDANFKFNPGTDTLSVTNLVVSGTQTTKDETIQVVTDNTISFEGSTADAHEIHLTGADATADRTITLPDATGTIALTSGFSGTNTGDEPDASLTVKGIVELATIAETNTGTDAGRAVTPDGLDGWTGSAQVTTLGTIGTGTWEGDTVAIDQGGTGNTSAASAFTALKQAASTTATGVVEYATAGETVTGSSSAHVASLGTYHDSRLVAVTIAASSVDSTRLRAEITHSLSTADIIVQLYDMTTEETVFACVERKDKDGTASTSKITVRFSAIPTNDVRCIIMSTKGASTDNTINYAA